MNVSRSDLRAIYRYLRQRQPALLRLLHALVIRESPSADKAGVDRLSRYLARQWQHHGARIRFFRQKLRGDVLRAELSFHHPRPQGQILLLHHLDTVHDRGTLRQMPFRLRRGRAYGPGTFDMKSGIVIGLAAVDALQHLRQRPRRKLVFLYTSDEEVGSEVGRPIIAREARASNAVLVLEPAAGPAGALKTARKGTAEFEFIVHGRAAHAGLEPEKGVSATLELAHQIPRIVALSQPRKGITVNIGVIEGGMRTNVVAAQARALIDVRVARMADVPRLAQRLRALRPLLPGARLELRGGVNRPPLERRPGVVRLFRQAQRLARQLGFELEETTVGGASDGNFTAALGIPTLDGLGGIGAGAHSPQEYVVVSSLAQRAALLAGLLLTL